MELTLEWIDKFLVKLGFSKQGSVYLKRYHHHSNYEIRVEINHNNLKKSQIFYNPKMETTSETNPEPTGNILLGDLTTSNFENPENFVVLEAVNRLLDLGYKPENIHLERKWKLGRTAKSGKADITVYEPNERFQERKTFMIIECKTWGKEFEKEKVRLFKNGGQLFSYFQQERDTKVLVLYTSTFDEGEITFDNVIIRVDDKGEETERLTKECEEQRKGENYPCTFTEAPDVSALVDVWKRVYNQFVFKHGVFEKDAGIYSLDLKPLKKKDLVPLKTSQGLFNAFAEILRHHNISDSANAFNKMMSLFLCKIVDEESKGNDDILDFQVKFGESFENLVDRLQALYKKGMENYLGIDDFVYYSDTDIQKILRLYPKRAKLGEIEEIFRQIKYYTNNEFAFKEIHNKKLFYQNALILSEIIELLQKYRLKYSHKNQILGNFFELLLHHGVKQSEGQFFTPLPIVRFMIISIAIDGFIKKKLEQSKDEEPLPKILDYACGVAHFLTEAIDEINKIIEAKQLKVQLPWEKRYIFGIEKDYRLARTAKIACFLNGDGSANIIFGDGLDDYAELELSKKKFDILLTNPPYSVKKFKSYLNVKPKYELLQFLTENSSEIEVLFVERAKQVLAEGGRVAIILPSSILSNSGIYTKTRELVLKYFELKAIAEFGSQTFIATGTNTVILFLERRGDWFVEDRYKIAVEIFDEKRIKDNDYINIEILFKMFVDFRDLPYDDYSRFVFQDEITKELNETEMFQTYREWFDTLTEIKNLRKKNSFQELSEEKQDKELEKRFKEKVRAIEKEKFFYFSLMFRKGERYGDENWYRLQKVVVTRAPSKTEEQKKYLGYKFNKRRGFEDIEIYRDENGKPITKLYDNDNYENPEKVAAYIRKNFKDEIDAFEAHDEIKEYLKIFNLPELFDFDRAGFDKQISLNPMRKIVIDTIWELKKLGEVFNVTIGGTPKRNEPKYWVNGQHPWVSVAELNGNIICDTKEKITTEGVKNSNAKLIPKGTTLVSFKLSIGKVGFTGIDLYTNEAIAALIPKDKTQVLDKYVFYLFQSRYVPIEIFGSKAFGQSMSSTFLKEKIKIPIPPLDVQKQIVAECQAIDGDVAQAEKTISEGNQRIETLFREAFEKANKTYRLSDSQFFEAFIGKRVLKNELDPDGKIPVFSANVFEPFGYINKLLIKDFSKASVLWGIDGDWMVRYMPANQPFYPTDHCGVLRVKTDEIHPRYLAWVLRHAGNKVGFSRSHRASIDRVSRIVVQVPPIDIQNEFAAQVAQIEQKIRNARTLLAFAEARKRAVLKKYLGKNT